jgi:hypothetical protein
MKIGCHYFSQSLFIWHNIDFLARKLENRSTFPLKFCLLNVSLTFFLMTFALVWITCLNAGTSFGAEVTVGNMTAPFSPGPEGGTVGNMTAPFSPGPEGGTVGNMTAPFSPEGDAVNATGSFIPSNGILKSELNEKKN